MVKSMTSHQVSVSAESFTATLFAWAGYDISVQYGANQPEYDLVAVYEEKMIKISVKGSQDGGWGLTQNFKKDRSYSEAIDHWINRHKGNTIVSLVQFQDVDFENGDIPRVYLATPEEIGEHMKTSRSGHGNTVLKESHLFKNGIGKGHTDEIPKHWKFSKKRIEELVGK
ncbi:hypothetical protein MKY15_21695 [Sporosarcina sp. FSL K6-1540]|uniref:hypothetical protein n=1 Tax=Sporosarcina sp. FSL K6-1540 TaxID=2921555 RepID=UPI00315A9A9F